MAKYAISKEGAASLNQLANDLLINANNIVETVQKLEQVTTSLYDNLGIYGDDILSIIHRNRQTLNVNREDIIGLAQRVKKQATDVENLVAMGLGDSSVGGTGCGNQASAQTAGGARTIANVAPGEPMSFSEADSGHVNPNYGLDRGYSINCQSCVVAFEARQRGYDVQVLPNTPGSMLETLSRDTSLAWIDPQTGNPPKYIYDDSKRTPEDYLDYIDGIIKPGERYTIQFAWAGRGHAGHIVNLDRTPNGLLRIKDNQRGENEKSEWIGDFAVLDYLSRMKYEDRSLFSSRPCVPQLLRVDNMDFNYDVVNQIMR